MCLTATGCGKSEPEHIRPLDQCGFVAQITRGEQNFEASFVRGENGDWTAVFSSPEALSEMTVISFGESSSVQYQGLTLELSADKLPAGSVATAIEQCIDHASHSASAKYSKDGDLKLIKGEAGCGEYELRVTKDGEPVSLYIGSEIAAEFSGFERLE